MYILGISCFYHDAAASLLKDGKIIAAAQEERFTRTKHDPGFPVYAVKFCLDFAKIKAEDLEAVAFYDKPFLKFERILMTSLEYFPRGLFSFIPAMRTWLTQKLWIKQLILAALPGFQGQIYFPEHHISHAASAFLVSNFPKACILTVDGVGEWATTTQGYGENLDINLSAEIHFPHSLGLLYSAFTYYLGFKVNSAEYKVMGLAPYGKPKYLKQIKDNLIDIKPDGSFNLNNKYFAYPYAEVMTSPAFHNLFQGEPRPLGSKPTQREMDLASSLQEITNEILLLLAKNLYQKYRTSNLCLAGGVALNCVANGEILKKTPFTNLFIQPAAGDAGGAIGAAAYVYHSLLRYPRKHQLVDVYLGPSYSNQEIKKLLKVKHLRYRFFKPVELAKKIAELISNQQVVGLFQGRMEFGPRALGNRSILADARNPDNKDRVNLKIKFRESFRPFAPSVLEEDCSHWFDLDVPSPYMLLVAQAKSQPLLGKKKLLNKFSQTARPVRQSLTGELLNAPQNINLNLLQSRKFSLSGFASPIPSVTHVDGSARIQTVNKKTNPFYWQIINQFKKLTGVPVIINTSFNQRGEPIVCTPEDALNCFLRTDMDYLAIGHFLIDKKDVPQKMIAAARRLTFSPD